MKLSRANFISLMLALFIAGGTLLTLPASAQAGVCQCKGSTTPSDSPCNTDKQCDESCGYQMGTSGTRILIGGTCVAGTEQPVGTNTGGAGGTTTGGGAATGLENPLGGICAPNVSGQQCIQLVIGNVIRAALGIIGSLALLIAIYGGFLWLTSGGNADKIKKGKDTLIWAVIGLAVIFAAYGIVSFVISALTRS